MLETIRIRTLGYQWRFTFEVSFVCGFLLLRQQAVEVSHSQSIWNRLMGRQGLRQLTDLLATDKSWYFALSRPIIVLSLGHRVCFLSAISRKSGRKKEKSVIEFTHEQNLIRSQTQLSDFAHEQTIICSQLFARHVVGSLPMKRKKNLHRMIIVIIALY